MGRKRNGWKNLRWIKTRDQHARCESQQLPHLFPHNFVEEGVQINVFYHVPKFTRSFLLRLPQNIGKIQRVVVEMIAGVQRKSVGNMLQQGEYTAYITQKPRRSTKFPSLRALNL